MSPDFLYLQDTSRPEYEYWEDADEFVVIYPIVQVFADPWLEAESVRRFSGAVLPIGRSCDEKR